MVGKIKNSKNDKSVSKMLIYKIKSTSLKTKIFLLIILAVVSFVSYRQTTIYLEKSDILAKQQKLEELADKIASQYPPDSRNDDQYCRYQSQKLSKGGRSCIISYKLIYSNLGLENANVKKNQISEINNYAALVNNLSPKRTDFDEKDFSTTKGYIHQDLPKNDMGGCYISYGYGEDLNNPSDLSVDVGCSIDTKSDYFPVRK